MPLYLRAGPSGPIIRGTLGQVLIANADGSVSFGGVSGAFGPLSRELYVDAGTTVPAADRDGSILAPFATIAAALAVAVLLPAGPVVINITAGTYAENIVLPPRNALTLQGSGPAATIVTGQAGAAALSWAPTAVQGAAISTFACNDLSINAAAGQRAIDFVSVTVAPDTMLAQGATFENVVTTSTIGNRFERIGQIVRRGCDWNTGTLLLRTCSIYNDDENCSVNAFDLSWDQAFAGGVPGLGRGGIELRGTVNGGVVLRDQAGFIAREDSNIDEGAAVNAVEGIGLSTNALPLAPTVLLHGIVTGPVVLPFPDAAVGLPGCELDRGQFFSTVSVSVTAGAARLAVTGRRGAAFFSTLTAGNLTDIDIRTSQFEQANLAVAGSGRIDRSHHQVTNEALPIGDNVITFAVPFPAAVTGSTAYVVTTQATEADPGGLGALYVDTKLNTSFMLHRTGLAFALGVDWTLTRPASL